ncbi:MAG TPA: PaaI family thioesterase [Myxococcota bacterium]|nr:PaaI family thioesterase [Myxococcota bacterium]
MSDARAPRRPWLAREPGQLVGRGHPAGDFLEAYLWRVVERGPGWLKVDAHLPDQARNPRGQLFGGFTPTYVDLISLFAARTGESESDSAPQWLATTNMRVDYFDPVTGPRFWLESRIVRERGRTVMIETRFVDPADGKLLVFALTTLRRVSRSTKLGDA